jgi:XTP/dITP diphosphohydrolase
MSTSYLQRLVEVMDTLRSPGGCPWDGEQTHESLVKYLLEESYEFVDSLENGDRAGMREELGDILLQVYFHARIAQDNLEDPFTIEDVAQSITEKLIRRHPHVFGDAKVSGSGEVLENWGCRKGANICTRRNCYGAASTATC